MINVEINRNPNESSLNIIRRFTKKVQGSGILPKVRSKRYAERDLSHYKTKKKTLKSLKRKAEVMKLIKMGKMQDKMSGNRYEIKPAKKEKPVTSTEEASK